jgi:Sulfotransferase domain
VAQAGSVKSPSSRPVRQPTYLQGAPRTHTVAWLVIKKMNPNDRVILFAHPRSGSSSLYQILQLHPDLNILEEPFNEHFTEWNLNNKNYLSLIFDIPSLDAQLADIFIAYNGVKVLDYQLPDDLAVHLLQRSDCKIIFLRRRNVLQSVVSVLIAEQTHLWKKWEMTRPLEEYYQNLQALDITEIQGRTRYLKDHLDFFEGVLDNRSEREAIKLTYEELYFASPAQRGQLMDDMWKLLEIMPLSQESYQNYFQPEKAKINSVETYSFIPNAEQIQQLCGDDETGWLYQ